MARMPRIAVSLAEDRRQLEGGHRDIGERRQHQRPDLRQDDLQEEQAAGQAERPAGLPLARRDRRDARAHDLADIGRDVQRERHEAGLRRRRGEAGQRRQREMDPHRLHQERREAHDVHEAHDRQAEELAAAQPPQRQEEARRHGEGEGRRQPDRGEEAPEQRLAEPPGAGEVERRKKLHQRSSRRARRGGGTTGASVMPRRLAGPPAYWLCLAILSNQASRAGPIALLATLSRMKTLRKPGMSVSAYLTA